MNIVVTGGVGFIGSHLCETLLKEVHKVICIDNFDEFYQLNIKIRNLFESTGNKKQFKIFEKEILSKNLSKNEIINSIKEFIKNDNYKLYFMDIRDKEIEKIFREEKRNTDKQAGKAYEATPRWEEKYGLEKRKWYKNE